MVSDSSMLMSIGNQEAAIVTPKSNQPILEGSGGKVADPVLTQSIGSIDAESSEVKGIVEQRSATSASGAQQSIDSFALNNNKSPRDMDPFSTAGAVFNSRG